MQSNLKEVFWNQPDLYLFDVSSLQWSRQATTGTGPPPAHTYASAHTVLDSRWVFWCGGYYGQAWLGLMLFGEAGPVQAYHIQFNAQGLRKDSRFAHV